MELNCFANTSVGISNKDLTIKHALHETNELTVDSVSSSSSSSSSSRE